MNPNTFSLVWPVYGGHADILRAYGIGVVSEAAFNAREQIARFAVFFVNATTGWTSPTCVAWINKLHLDTNEPALVGNLRLQVCEGPGVQDAPLLSISPNPRANVREVFKRNPSFRAFSFGNNLFGNFVIGLLYKAAFTARNSIQHSVGRARAFGLKAFALAESAIANACNLRGVPVRLPVRVLGDVYKTEINPKPSNRFLLHRIWYVHADEQKPFTAAKNKLTFAFGKLKQLALFLATNKRHLGTARYHPNVDSGACEIKPQHPAIVGDCAMLAKYDLGFLINLVSTTNFGVHANHRLGRKRKFGSYLTVEQFVKWELSKLLLVQCELRKAITSCIDNFQSFAQQMRLFWRRHQLYLDGQNQ